MFGFLSKNLVKLSLNLILYRNTVEKGPPNNFRYKNIFCEKFFCRVVYLKKFFALIFANKKRGRKGGDSIKTCHIN